MTTLWRWISLGALVTSLAAVGIALTSNPLGATSEAHSQNIETNRGSDTPEVRELRQIREILESIKISLAATNTARNGNNSDKETNVDSTIQLKILEAIRSLNGRIDTTVTGIQPLSLISGDPKKSQESLLALAPQAEREPFEAWKLVKMWDYQRTVEKYGQPDAININDGIMRWRYNFTSSLDGGKRVLAFNFFDGMLFHIDVFKQ
ncbi:MAG: hypothetical protein ACKVS6_01330 [Planctomycetota bacterium]